MDLITFDDDTLLEDVIDEEMYEEIVTIMEAQGMPEEMVNSLEPWYITSGLQEEEEGNATFDAGVDWHYLERAVEDGKEIEELEGQIISLLALNEQSLELQLEQLEDVMNPEDVDMPDVDGDDLVEMWLAGEEEPLIEYWEEVTYGEEYDRVYLWDRNERNADIIDEILQEDDGQTYLALIGAFHFFIEPGVQDFLEERGYTVERIN
ncbi:hypothetical protein JCM19037_2359 [Geomicrobium sp. JCM 19037]|nr:hypothetical protein JCM19037_2359 [Geomicrobium sp. JCM 19037]